MDFELKLIAGSQDATGSLLLLAPDRLKVERFLTSYIECAFPSGGRGSTLLSAETKDSGIFILEARGGGQIAKISMSDVPGEIGLFIKRTLENHGSIPIVFGFYEQETITLLEPTGNHLIKTDAFIDDSFVNGTSPDNWNNFLNQLMADFRWVKFDPPA